MYNTYTFTFVHFKAIMLDVKNQREKAQEPACGSATLQQSCNSSHSHLLWSKDTVALNAPLLREAVRFREIYWVFFNTPSQTSRLSGLRCRSRALRQLVSSPRSVVGPLKQPPAALHSLERRQLAQRCAIGFTRATKPAFNGKIVYV